MGTGRPYFGKSVRPGMGHTQPDESRRLGVAADRACLLGHPELFRILLRLVLYPYAVFCTFRGGLDDRHFSARPNIPISGAFAG